MRDHNVGKLNFRFSARYINRLDQLADQTGLNRSAVLRALLDRADALLDTTNGGGVIVIGNNGVNLQITASQRAAG